MSQAKGEVKREVKKGEVKGETLGVFSALLDHLPSPLRSHVEGYENYIGVFLVLLLFAISWYGFNWATSWGGEQFGLLPGHHSPSQLSRAPPKEPAFEACKMSSRKIAFLFLVQNDITLAPLWDKFFQGHEGLYSIYINLIPGISLTDLPPTFKGAQQFHYEYNVGNMGLADAEVELLTHALQDRDNYRFIFLSESCIPVYGFHFFYQYFMNSSLSYVDIITDEGERSSERYSDCLSPVVPREAWTKGSPWMAVGYEAAVLIVSDKQYFPKFKECCASNPGIFPDEHYIQTLLRSTAPHLLANRTLTWGYWIGGAPRYYTYIDQALIDLIRSGNCTWNGILNSPCHLVAREFTASSLPSLLEYSHLLYS